MSEECPIIPRLTLDLSLDHHTFPPTPDFIPRPPAAPLKIGLTPSLRQSNTALIPQITPIMIGKNSACLALPYKKILRGRLGVRSHLEIVAHGKSSNPSEPLGSQTFRSTMEVLNGRCGSLTERSSKSASSSEINRASESASSWYERRSQALSAFGAPFFGIFNSADGQHRTAEKKTSNDMLRPHSSGEALANPCTAEGPGPLSRRPTTAAAFKVDGHAQSADHFSTNAVPLNRRRQQPTIEPVVTGPCQDNTGPSSNIHSDFNPFSDAATHLSTASSLPEKTRDRNENSFLFPSQGIVSPSTSCPNRTPSLEQAMTEVTKGQPLKKFSHASQRVAIKVLRVNFNAELLIDNELHERVVAIFDGLSAYLPPKRGLHSQDDFIPKFVQRNNNPSQSIVFTCANSVNRYIFNPTLAFHILLMNEEYIDVIADNSWSKQCWMTGIRLMLAQMKSKFKPLPIRLPGEQCFRFSR